MLMATTLAWFTDREYNVNTMVAGKISIEQTETDKDGNPFVNGHFVMMPSETVVKNVTVKNTGNQDCYVRTLFAFEDSADGKVLSMLTTAGGAIVIPGVTDTTVPKVQFTVTKDGKATLFTVGYYVHATALAENEKINPLSGITLSAAAENAWHEAVGSHYELFALSQATQTAGLGNDAAVALDTAFKPISAAECATWFNVVLQTTEYQGSTIAAYTPTP
jgi:hypothetical protein